MVLFFCSTPFQIYQIINIKTKYYKEKKSTLYILKYFGDAPKYVDLCKETGLFEDVILVDCWKMYQRIADAVPENSLIQKVKAKSKHLFWKIYYYRINNNIFDILSLDKEQQIEEAFFSYYEPLAVMLSIKLAKTGIKINCFEDGLATYVFGVTYEKRLPEKITNVPDCFLNPAKVFVHFPEVVKNVESLKAEIIKVDYSDNKEARDLLYKIFDIVNVDEIKESAVYFDTLAENQDMDSMILPLKDFSREQIVYKKHPRRPDKYYEDRSLNVYRGASLPFEMYCEYFDVSDKLLISHCSSACFTPMIFFGQNPTIIFCYKFATTSGLESYKRYDDFIERLKKFKPDLKLYSPETKEEYEELIKDFQINL